MHNKNNKNTNELSNKNRNTSTKLVDAYGLPIEFAQDGVKGDHILAVHGEGSQNLYGVTDEKEYNQYSNRFV